MKTWASRWQTWYVRIRKSVYPRRMLASFCRGPRTAQSTIKAFYELPHHAFQPCCAYVTRANSINGSGEISEAWQRYSAGRMRARSMRCFARIRGSRRGNSHRPGLRSNRLRTAQAEDRNVVAGQLFLSESKFYVLANSPLRGMSAVPYSISDRVQPLRQ